MRGWPGRDPRSVRPEAAIWAKGYHGELREPQTGHGQLVDHGPGSLRARCFDDETGSGSIVARPDLSDHAISVELPSPVRLVRKNALEVGLLELFDATRWLSTMNCICYSPFS